MKPLAALLSLFALPLGIFGYWGLFTSGGRKRYDEMAAMYPAFALLASLLLLLVVIVLMIVTILKSKRKQR